MKRRKEFIEKKREEILSEVKFVFLNVYVRFHQKILPKAKIQNKLVLRYNVLFNTLFLLSRGKYYKTEG